MKLLSEQLYMQVMIKGMRKIGQQFIITKIQGRYLCLYLPESKAQDQNTGAESLLEHDP